ncbi:MAG: helix-turn-helix domain-containing protein [Treponema sp.]|nr:helix-turn-helix domain-containing protein [Treponema sp.]
MKIQRVLKTRIYPTEERRVVLNKTLGCCCFLYNKTLNERIETYELLKEVDAVVLQRARRNLKSAYSNFYQSLKKSGNAGVPRYKAKQ